MKLETFLSLVIETFFYLYVFLNGPLFHLLTSNQLYCINESLTSWWHQDVVVLSADDVQEGSDQEDDVNDDQQ